MSDAIYTDGPFQKLMGMALALHLSTEGKREILQEIAKLRADLTTPDTRDALIKELVEALDMSRRRLERIADEAWNGDARDFKRLIPGVFAEFDAALRKAEEAGYGAE